MRWRLLTLLVVLLALALAMLSAPLANHSSATLKLDAHCQAEALSSQTVSPSRKRQMAHALLGRNDLAQDNTVSSEITNRIPELNSLQDLDVDPETLGAFVNSLPVTQVSTLLEKLAITNDRAFDDLASQLISRWAKENVLAAAAWAAQPSDPAFRVLACEQVAIAWVGQDASAASEWVISLPEGEARSAAIQAAAYEMSRTDPMAALELTIDLPAGAQRDELLAHAVSQWAVISAGEAVDWAKQIPDEELRTRLLGAVAVSLAKDDPAAAANLLSANIAPGEQQNRAAVLVAAQWAQSSPEQAASWVQEFPEGAARDAAKEALEEVRH